jgi:hypothetical protein
MLLKEEQSVHNCDFYLKAERQLMAQPRPATWHPGCPLSGNSNVSPSD